MLKNNPNSYENIVTAFTPARLWGFHAIFHYHHLNSVTYFQKIL